jgi:hypothetical protein
MKVNVEGTRNVLLAAKNAKWYASLPWSLLFLFFFFFRQSLYLCLSLSLSAPILFYLPLPFLLFAHSRQNSLCSHYLCARQPASGTRLHGGGTGRQRNRQRGRDDEIFSEYSRKLSEIKRSVLISCLYACTCAYSRPFSTGFLVLIRYLYTCILNDQSFHFIFQRYCDKVPLLFLSLSVSYAAQRLRSKSHWQSTDLNSKWSSYAPGTAAATATATAALHLLEADMGTGRHGGPQANRRAVQVRQLQVDRRGIFFFFAFFIIYVLFLCMYVYFARSVLRNLFCTSWLD